MGIWTKEGLLEAYVFESHIDAERAGATKQRFADAPGVRFVGQFVGHFTLFGRVVAESLGQLQERIEGDYWESGIHSAWSLNLTASSAAAPKRGSPDFCALVCARAGGDPFEIRDMLDDGFLREGEGAAVVNARDFDLLVDLGADSVDGLLERVLALRDVSGIGRTATSFADLADNAIRPSAS
ncbi:MAG: hypothetical protein ABJB55_10770 [Actinomycetota bacterium]